jgi:hypothetical protein
LTSAASRHRGQWGPLPVWTGRSRFIGLGRSGDTLGRKSVDGFAFARTRRRDRGRRLSHHTWQALILIPSGMAAVVVRRPVPRSRADSPNAKIRAHRGDSIARAKPHRDRVGRPSHHTREVAILIPSGMAGRVLVPGVRVLDGIPPFRSRCGPVRWPRTRRRQPPHWSLLRGVAGVAAPAAIAERQAARDDTAFNELIARLDEGDDDSDG